MSNGTTCCAAEICCDSASARLAVRKALIARGVPDEYCDVLDAFLDHEGLMYTPVSLRPFINEIVAMALKHEQHGHE